MKQAVHFYAIFETAAGYCGIAWNDLGVTRFRLPSRTAEATERALLQSLQRAEPGIPTAAVAGVIAAARRYFEGEMIDFSVVAIDFANQPPLFRQIYDATRRVGWGRTTTYGALAKELGAGPEVARDVGRAMASNPVPLIIPCHRVLAAGGKIGGFSAPGGSGAKLRMLRIEGVDLPAPKPTQSSLRL